MSIENVRLFYAKLAEDKPLRERVARAGEDLKEKLKTVQDFKAEGHVLGYTLLEPFAREAGCPFALEDLERFETEKDRELTELELEALSGGAACACVIGGGGGGSQGSCVCVVIGTGGVRSSKVYDCMCIVGGAGDTP